MRKMEPKKKPQDRIKLTPEQVQEIKKEREKLIKSPQIVKK